MIFEKIRALQNAERFKPYTVVTNDGKELYVKHPDYLLIPPHHQTLDVYSSETEWDIVQVANIARVALGGAKQKVRARKR